MDISMYHDTHKEEDKEIKDTKAIPNNHVAE
jgi:hypothetical protein